MGVASSPPLQDDEIRLGMSRCCAISQEGSKAHDARNKQRLPPAKVARQHDSDDLRHAAAIRGHHEIKADSFTTLRIAESEA